MLETLLGFGDALIGLLGVIVGGGVVSLREWWTSKVERRRDGSYSAIRLICILEEYADKCIDVVGDDGTAYGQPAGRTKDGEQYYEVQVRAPDPLEFPDDIAWRSLKEPLMHRILAMPNRARSTGRHINAVAENASPPGYEEVFGARHEGYAKIGLEALSIADDLRTQFNIDARGRAHLNTGWDPKAFLQEKVAEFKKNGV